MEKEIIICPACKGKSTTIRVFRDDEFCSGGCGRYVNRRHNKVIPEITISVKFKAIAEEQYYVVQSTSDIAHVLRQLFDQDTIEWKEEFMLLCLNQSNKVVGFYRVSSGGMTGTVADPKIIYTIALNCAATKIILAHNHPSGNLKPSNADHELTRKIKDAGKLFDIMVLDHIIITRDKHLSFAEEGWV